MVLLIKSWFLCRINWSNKERKTALFPSGHYIKMKIAANATVTISGIYYQAGNWDSFKVNGGEALAGAASGSVTFTTGEEGGEFIITAEGTQAFFTTITVTFN